MWAVRVGLCLVTAWLFFYPLCALLAPLDDASNSDAEVVASMGLVVATFGALLFGRWRLLSALVMVWALAVPLHVQPALRLRPGIPDGALSGKVVVITGVSGIAEHVAEAFAARGAHVVLASRNLKRSQAVVDRLNDPGAAAAVAGVARGRAKHFHMDNSDLSTVAPFVGQVAAAYDQVDVLIANAGIATLGSKPTVDGFDLMVSVNHLAHALLIHEATPLLLASAEPRVIEVSSVAHRFLTWTLGLERLLDFVTPAADGNLAYGRTKLLNVLHARGLARAHSGAIKAYSLHPGAVRTAMPRELFRDEPRKLHVPEAAMPIVSELGVRAVNAVWREPAVAASIYLYTAAAPEADLPSGSYVKNARAAVAAGSDEWADAVYAATARTLAPFVSAK